MKRTIAESKSSPQTIQKISKNSYYYNYNIEEIEKELEGGGTETFYKYNYVEIEGTPTKLKVLEAIRGAESSTDTELVESVATNRSEAQEQLAAIAGMTYVELDNYVESTFGNLAVAQKTALKKLHKVVLAILKQMDLS